MAIVDPNSHAKLTKYEIMPIYYLLQIGFDLPLFGPKMSIFILIYLHLPLFTYIWPNVALITLI